MGGPPCYSYVYGMSLPTISSYQDLSDVRLPIASADVPGVQCGKYLCGSTGYSCPLCAVKVLVGLCLSERGLHPLSVSNRWSDAHSCLDMVLRTSSTYLGSSGGVSGGVPSNTLLCGPSYRELYGLVPGAQEGSL